MIIYKIVCRFKMTETEIKVDATTLPVEKKEMPEKKPRSPRERGGRKQARKGGVGRDEGALEREFKNFAVKLRKQFGEDCQAYQVSNYPEGLEFTVRVPKKSGGEGARFIKSFGGQKQIGKREKKELTEEQKAKRAEKQAKRREYLEKKRQERLENDAKEDGSRKEELAKESP